MVSGIVRSRCNAAYGYYCEGALPLAIDACALEKGAAKAHTCYPKYIECTTITMHYYHLACTAQSRGCTGMGEAFTFASRTVEYRASENVTPLLHHTTNNSRERW